MYRAHYAKTLLHRIKGRKVPPIAEPTIFDLIDEYIGDLVFWRGFVKRSAWPDNVTEDDRPVPVEDNLVDNNRGAGKIGAPTEYILLKVVTALTDRPGMADVIFGNELVGQI